jgi:hypothetical protein
LESIYPALLKDEVKNNLILGAAGQTMQIPDVYLNPPVKLALGRAAERRPTGKMLRRRKMLGIAPESPASGASGVSLRAYCSQTH